uniref:Uncharacterized protein n=1 Tax=Romanomermis culicivorax TaxID=13658 RepID=A0A915HZQ5_ROMCU
MFLLKGQFDQFVVESNRLNFWPKFSRRQGNRSGCANYCSEHLKPFCDYKSKYGAEFELMITKGGWDGSTSLMISDPDLKKSSAGLLYIAPEDEEKAQCNQCEIQLSRKGHGTRARVLMTEREEFLEKESRRKIVFILSSYRIESPIKFDNLELRAFESLSNCSSKSDITSKELAHLQNKSINKLLCSFFVKQPKIDRLIIDLDKTALPIG